MNEATMEGSGGGEPVRRSKRTIGLEESESVPQSPNPPAAHHHHQDFVTKPTFENVSKDVMPPRNDDSVSSLCSGHPASAIPTREATWLDLLKDVRVISLICFMLMVIAGLAAGLAVGLNKGNSSKSVEEIQSPSAGDTVNYAPSLFPSVSPLPTTLGPTRSPISAFPSTTTGETAPPSTSRSAVPTIAKPLATNRPSVAIGNPVPIPTISPTTMMDESTPIQPTMTPVLQPILPPTKPPTSAPPTTIAATKPPAPQPPTPTPKPTTTTTTTTPRPPPPPTPTPRPSPGSTGTGSSTQHPTYYPTWNPTYFPTWYPTTWYDDDDDWSWDDDNGDDGDDDWSWKDDDNGDDTWFGNGGDDDTSL